jgi:hypothetical protein
VSVPVIGNFTVAKWQALQIVGTDTFSPFLFLNNIAFAGFGASAGSAILFLISGSAKQPTKGTFMHLCLVP